LIQKPLLAARHQFMAPRLQVSIEVALLPGKTKGDGVSSAQRFFPDFGGPKNTNHPEVSPLALAIPAALFGPPGLQDPSKGRLESRTRKVSWCNKVRYKWVAERSKKRIFSQYM